uniref:Uncharacterized protein n=2 Tax=Oryza TaxID=4527 RepID=A0A0E0D0P3_9ORYZ
MVWRGLLSRNYCSSSRCDIGCGDTRRGACYPTVVKGRVLRTDMRLWRLWSGLADVVADHVNAKMHVGVIVGAIHGGRG